MNKKLQMPENISLRWELIRGFGAAELARSSVVVVAVLIISIVAARLARSDGQPIISVMSVIVAMFVCICLFTRYEGNRSIYEYLRLARKYHTDQQTFRYKTKDEVIEFETESKPETADSAGVPER